MARPATYQASSGSNLTAASAHSLIGDAATAGGLVNNVGNPSIVGVDPLLGPLVDNGGPTPTLALLAGSPAIDKERQRPRPPLTRPPAC